MDEVRLISVQFLRVKIEFYVLTNDDSQDHT